MTTRPVVRGERTSGFATRRAWQVGQADDTLGQLLFRQAELEKKRRQCIERQFDGDPSRVADIAVSIAERSPLGRGSTPADVAEAVCFLAIDASGYITGQTLAVDAGKIVAPPRMPEG